MHWLLALSIVTGLPPQAPTELGFVDASQLSALCGTSGSNANSARLLCLGYVVGAVDQLLAAQARRGRSTLCPPQDLTATGAMQEVVRHSSKREGLTCLTSIGPSQSRRWRPCPYGSQSRSAWRP